MLNIIYVIHNINVIRNFVYNNCINPTCVKESYNCYRILHDKSDFRRYGSCNYLEDISGKEINQKNRESHNETNILNP